MMMMMMHIAEKLKDHFPFRCTFAPTDCALILKAKDAFSLVGGVFNNCKRDRKRKVRPPTIWFTSLEVFTERSNCSLFYK